MPVSPADIDELASRLWEAFKGRKITLDTLGRPNYFVVRHLARRLLEVCYEAGIKDPLYEIDWEAVLDPDLEPIESLNHFISWIARKLGKKIELTDRVDIAITEIEKQIHYLREELKTAPPEHRPEIEEEIKRLTTELERLRRAKKPVERKVKTPKPRPKPVPPKAPPLPPPKVIPPPPPPPIPKDVRETQRLIEDYITKKVPVYRFDWRDKEYGYLGVRISFHRDVEEALKKAIAELGGKVERVVRPKPPLVVYYVDFRGVKIPVPPPKPPAPIEKRLAEIKSEFISKVRKWAELYTPGRLPAVLRDAEEEFRKAENDLRSALEAGREDMVKDVLTTLLRDKARVIASINRRALEHPEIAELLPPPKPPEVAVPGVPPEVEVEVERLPSEIRKWARWLAKLERRVTLEGLTARTLEIMRPTIEHPNPLIAHFPPLGEKVNDIVHLHPTTLAGLTKICERLGIKIEFKLDWSVGELLHILDEIYSKGTKYDREWVDVLRETVGI